MTSEWITSRAGKISVTLKKETTYYWEHYKDLKKPGTCSVNGFFGTEKAIEIIKSCEARYMAKSIPSLWTERSGFKS